MNKAQQVIYRYSGQVTDVDVIQDPLGKHQIPNRGEIISRRGKQWKVARVSIERSGNPKGPVPVVRISLTANVLAV
jgi:hypothetical protein